VKGNAMPLLDHFRPPLHPQRSWESFHARWATAIADTLDRTLPPRYFAEVHTRLGSQVEADIADFERPAEPSGNGPAAGVVFPAVFPDDFEVEVRDARDDARLVAVVELVSPANKDRPETRRAFAAKCAAYLQRGIGLVVVDIVTVQQFNLHNEMVAALKFGEAFAMPADPHLYAIAYRPARRQETNQIDVWPGTLTVGGTLPLLPLALRGTRAIPLDLEASYTDACQRSRL